MKSFGVPFEYVIYEMSFANIQMYSSVLPSYNVHGTDKNGKSEKVINGDDPEMADMIDKLIG